MWFQVHPTDMSFTLSSPFQLRNEAVIPATPERVFEILSTAELQHEWFKDFKAARWTSAAPHGVGSTRVVELKALAVKERFLAWDPGKRLSFCVYASTIPLTTEMLEDLQLEPAEGGGTRFRWTVHYTPTLPTRLLHPLVRRVFGQLFNESIEGLRRYAARK